MILSVADVRPHLRVTGDVFDSEIEMLMDAAKADMQRVGVDSMAVDYGEPLANTAIICYCKARFGFDNPDSDRYELLYRQMVTDLLNSKANVAARSE